MDLRGEVGIIKGLAFHLKTRTSGSGDVGATHDNCCIEVLLLCRFGVEDVEVKSCLQS